ncbi:hypothetical protein AVEN_89391-1, partial [Araneus ventricosus]
IVPSFLLPLASLSVLALIGDGAQQQNALLEFLRAVARRCCLWSCVWFVTSLLELSLSFTPSRDLFLGKSSNIMQEE